jgi:L-lactate utilization protein LutB
MKIFLYFKAGDQSGDILEKIIKTHLPGVEMAVYSTIDDLSKSLRQPIENSGIAILLVSNQEDLKNILSIRYLFQNIKTILLLPNKAPETVALAHQLRPRFLTDINTDLAEVIAVLKKMLKDQ